MEVTPIGWLLIMTGLFLFAVRPHWLYVAAIFFIPFTDTAVANLGSGSGVFSLQATMLFGALWLVSQMLNILFTRRLRVARQQRVTLSALIIFCGVALVSLVMPIAIDGATSIPAGRSILEWAEVPIRLSQRNITQWVYLLYGVTLAVFITIKNSNPDRFASTIRIYLWSCIFVSLWGLMQAALFRLHIPYPNFIFNTATTQAAGGYTQAFSDSTTRIASVAIEPSMLAQCLVIVLPMIWFSMIAKRPIISRRIDLFALVVILLCLVLSTSSTAYLGIAGATFISIALLGRSGRLRLRHLAWCGGLLALAVAAFTAIPVGRAITQEMLINKPQSWSALERIMSAVLGWRYFLQYPILGIGWGTLPPSSLITYLLAHTGVLGLAAFAVLMVFVIRGLAAYTRRPASNLDGRAMWAVGILGSLLTSLFVCLFSGFPFYFSHFWLILGISIAAPYMAPTQPTAIPSCEGLKPKTCEEAP